MIGGHQVTPSQHYYIRLGEGLEEARGQTSPVFAGVWIIPGDPGGCFTTIDSRREGVRKGGQAPPALPSSLGVGRAKRCQAEA